MIIGLQGVRDSSEMLKDYVISFTVEKDKKHKRIKEFSFKDLEV